MSLKDFIHTYSHNLAIKAEQVTPQASYYTNGMGFAWGAVTLSEWLMIFTAILGLLTFAVNLYYQHKRNRRERESQEMKRESHDKHMNNDSQ